MAQGPVISLWIFRRVTGRTLSSPLLQVFVSRGPNGHRGSDVMPRMIRNRMTRLQMGSLSLLGVPVLGNVSMCD